MTADGWAPIEPTREETRSPDDSGEHLGAPPVGAPPVGGPSDGASERRPRRRWLVILGVLVAVAVTAAVVVVMSGRSGGSGESDAAESDGTPASEPAADATPSQVWSVATRRLTEAGTFAYRGTVRSDGPSLQRPGIWRQGQLSVEGEVELPERAHEIAIDETGHVVETVSEHVVVWSRQAANEDSLAAQPFGVVAELDSAAAGSPSGSALMSSAPAGSALILTWLTEAVDRAADGTDSQGRRRYTGSLDTLAGPNEFSEPAPEPIAEIALVVDESGNPVRIELSSLPGQPSLELAFDISGIGEAVPVPLPDGRPGSVRGNVTVDQVRAAGISDPVEFGALPADWVLFDTALLADVPGPGCSTLSLGYADVPFFEDLDNAVRLGVRSAACPLTLGLTGEPIALGPFTGTVDEGFDGHLTVEASDGVTTIEISTDLSIADLTALGASLRPFDPDVALGTVAALSEG